MAITTKGYVKRTSDEIKAELVQSIKDAGYTSFTEQPADIQNMLLDTAIQPLMQMENAIATILNGYTPAFENDFMFLQMGRGTLNLTPKLAIKAQVLLKFTGKAGDFIPQATKVGSFETTEALTLNEQGEGYVNATSTSETAIQQPDTITKITTTVPDGVSATNPNASYAPVDSETFSQFKTRSQELLRSPRTGTLDYAYTTLKAVDGVDSRLLNFYIKEWQTTNDDGTIIAHNAIEAVVGGGDISEVANALFNCFLQTEKLVSSPSDSDTTRTQSYDINYLDKNTFTIKYTTPKVLTLSLVFLVKFKANQLSPITISLLYQDALNDFILEKRVGDQITEYELKNLMLNQMTDNGYDIVNVSEITITPSIDGTQTTWSEYGDLDEIKFDCYLDLDSITINSELEQ